MRTPLRRAGSPTSRQRRRTPGPSKTGWNSWPGARASYERAQAGDRERVRRQHASIDQMASDFAAGQSKAVAGYFAEVLAVQSYPGDFPTGVKIAYKPAAQEMIVDIDLPLLDAVPGLASCEYLPGKKELRYKKLAV